MKKYIIILFALISWFAKGQEYDFQEMCTACAEAQGYYCGDDPLNWTQYAPMGCVQASWLNDGWEDCVDAGDENGAVPTSVEDCIPEPPACDTVFVEIPIIQYEYIFDTIVEYETIIELDTVVEYETIVEYDTIIEIQYEEILEYIDCDTGLPCSSGMNEILDKSNTTGLMYNLLGQPIRKPEGIYIEGGKIKYIVD
mgnify:CR=1 FL=1